MSRAPMWFGSMRSAALLSAVARSWSPCRDTRCPAEIAACVVWGETDQRGVVGDGAVGVLGALVGPAAVPIGIGEARVDPDRGVEVRHRALRIAGIAVAHSAPVVGDDELRIELDGLAEIGDRAAGLIELQVDRAATEVGRRQAGIGGDCVVVVVDRACRVARLLPRQTAAMQRVGADVGGSVFVFDDLAAGREPRLRLAGHAGSRCPSG